MITDRETRLLRIVGGLVERKLTLTKGRTHKAGSAESILRHCLRQLGYTKRYNAGRLTGKQTLRLLEAIREYSRAWLRHEAEAFARHYLGWTERGLVMPAVHAGDVAPVVGGVVRAFEPIKSLAAHTRRFFQRAKSFVRESIVAGAMAILGPAPLTGEDLNEAEKAAQVQDQFFDKFQGEVVAAPPIFAPDQPSPFAMTPGQFIARTELYGNAPYNAGQSIARAHYLRNRIFDQERGIHVGDDEPCQVCQDRVSQGWQPIGTLRPIGDSTCRCNCHCLLAYRLEFEGGKGYMLGKKKSYPLPEGY